MHKWLFTGCDSGEKGRKGKGKKGGVLSVCVSYLPPVQK